MKSFVQFIRRHFDSIFLIFVCFSAVFGFVGFIALAGHVNDYIEISDVKYAEVSGWYAEGHVRPLIVSALSDGEISYSEYFKIRDSLSNKDKLNRLIQGVN